MVTFNTNEGTYKLYGYNALTIDQVAPIENGSAMRFNKTVETPVSIVHLVGGDSAVIRGHVDINDLYNVVKDWSNEDLVINPSSVVYIQYNRTLVDIITNVTEKNIHNMFVVKEGVKLTPRVGKCLDSWDMD